MKLHYGIISTATITDRFINAVLANGDVVEAIASRDFLKAQAKANQFNIKKAYGSYEELYADRDINIVYIATNNATHVQEIRNALKHHKHVVCEKPLALSEVDAIELFAYAKQQNCFLMEAQKSVFLPVTTDLKNKIHNRSLGTLQEVTLCATFPTPNNEWMLDPKQGGVLYGSASYTLEYLDFLIEPETSKVRVISKKQHPGVACEFVHFHALFDDVSIHSTIIMGELRTNEAIFHFQNGTIVVPNYWKATAYTMETNNIKTDIEHTTQYEMVYEVKHINECVSLGLQHSSIMPAKRTISCCKMVDELIKAS